MGGIEDSHESGPFMVSLNVPASDPMLAAKQDIESMRTRGAGAIGKQATRALAATAAAYREGSFGEFTASVTEAARELATARPTAVTLRNGLNAMLQELHRSKSVAEGQERLRAAADAYARRVDEAKGAIARRALALFQPNDVVLTHCHSTAAGGAIAHAARHLAGLRVFATETRPFRQGLIQAPALAKEGVDVTLIVDAAVAHMFETARVTRVVVGADTVAADGSLYNKIGTRQVAELARRFGVPFLVCAERDKFSPYTLRGDAVTLEERAPAEIVDGALVPGVKVLNPVFDRTPPELVDVYVTEGGLLQPTEVRSFIEREFREVSAWI